MGALDLFQNSRAEADSWALRNSAARPPATFGEAFDAAWTESRLFGQSLAGVRSRQESLDDYLEEVRAKTGTSVGVPSIDGVPDMSQIAEEVEKLRATNPGLDVPPLTDQSLEERAVAKSRAAREAGKEMAAREKTLGGTFGSFAGSAAGGISDPVNVLTFPLAAPAGMGVLATAGIWAAIGLGTQTAIEVVGAPFRSEVDPSYSASGEPLRNVVGAGLFAGATGGTLKLLGNAWSRVRTGEWPRNIRDAGNVVDSEAQIAATNPVLGSVDGEAMHRGAMQKSIDDILADRPLDVDATLPPEMQAAIAAQNVQTVKVRPQAPVDEGTGQFRMPLEQPREAPPRIPAEPDIEATKALAAEMSPKRVEEIVADANGEVAETVARDLDRLRAERGDIEVPMGTQFDSDGRPVAVMRKVDDVLAEAAAREKAANEIMLCVGPQPEAGP